MILCCFCFLWFCLIDNCCLLLVKFSLSWFNCCLCKMFSFCRCLFSCWLMCVLNVFWLWMNIFWVCVIVVFSKFCWCWWLWFLLLLLVSLLFNCGWCCKNLVNGWLLISDLWLKFIIIYGFIIGCDLWFGNNLERMKWFLLGLSRYGRWIIGVWWWLKVEEILLFSYCIIGLIC